MVEQSKNRSKLHSSINRIAIVGLMIFSSVIFCPGINAENHMTGVQSKILVHATPEEVFDAIRHYRHSDAAKRSVVEEKKGRATIKEKFIGLPILGDVDCTYEEVEVPYTRIDYQLINSEKLKVFEGSWNLTPLEDGKATEVKLTSYVDSYMNVPAKAFLTHIQAHEDIHKRLTYVKKIAECEDAEKKEAAGEKK